MRTIPRVLALAAASAVLGFGALHTAPAAAFDYGYDDRDGNRVGYDDEDYGAPRGYGYDRPAPYGYGHPGYEVRSGEIAICPPGYHLGRHGALCWPN